MSDKPPSTSPHTSEIPERGENIDSLLQQALTLAWAILGGGPLEDSKRYVSERLQKITSWGVASTRTSDPKGSDSPDLNMYKSNAS
jgi:hypothetical protein